VTEPPAAGRSIVAVVGRPNVGKSTLVNRIVGRREAIVAETPGVTRDRRSFTAEWNGRAFTVMDTGGLEPGQHGLEADVAAQARAAIAAADVIVLVVDTSVGPLEDDTLVAAMLRRSGARVIVAANKVDGPADEPGVAAFHRLGLGEPRPISALHGRGTGDLLDAVVASLPDHPASVSGEWASVAIVGRPNVGKSSLLNALVGAARAIVAPEPGTTRDPVDSLLELPEGRILRVVDTAGMRRQVRVQDPIEYFSWLRARDTLRRVDVVALVVDASEGVTGHDQRLAEEIAGRGRACVVVLNKWDAVTDDDADRRRLEAAIAERLRFVAWADRVRASALTGRGVERVVRGIVDAAEAHRLHLPTAAVNRVLGDAQSRRPAPRRGGRATAVRYATQVGERPPTIALFASGALPAAYLRYLERSFRDAFSLRGTPLRLVERVQRST
jgi:GTP-binding protein